MTGDGNENTGGLLYEAIYQDKEIESAPVVCTDPECGYSYVYLLDPETQSWDDVDDYMECGYAERDHDPCPAPAKVFKEEAGQSQEGDEQSPDGE